MREWFRSTRSPDTLDEAARRNPATTSARAAPADVHAMLDAVPDGVMTVDANGHIQSCNAAAAALFGCAVHKLLGQRVINVLPALDALRQPTAEAPDEPQAHTQTLQAQRLDGTTFPLEVRWHPMASTRHAPTLNDKHLTLFVLRDVSEHQRIERMQRDFVSVVSHELRTPLTSIRGALSLLADGSTGKLPADAQRMIHMAADNCERLVALVNDILDMDKMNNGHMVIMLRTHDLVKLLRENLRSTLGFARLHKVRLLMPGHAGPVWAHVDAQRINQIMGNLLSNAIKFSPSGADVSVHIDLTPVAHPTHATIVVSDQGMGIPLDFHPRVFEPFAQADSTDQRAKGGTGLGLSIAKALVQRMAGTILFDCPAAGGTRFFVTFPLAPSPHEPSDFALTGLDELRL